MSGSGSEALINMSRIIIIVMFSLLFLATPSSARDLAAMERVYDEIEALEKDAKGRYRVPTPAEQGLLEVLESKLKTEQAVGIYKTREDKKAKSKMKSFRYSGGRPERPPRVVDAPLPEKKEEPKEVKRVMGKAEARMFARREKEKKKLEEYWKGTNVRPGFFGPPEGGNFRGSIPPGILGLKGGPGKSSDIAQWGKTPASYDPTATKEQELSSVEDRAARTA